MTNSKGRSNSAPKTERGMPRSAHDDRSRANPVQAFGLLSVLFPEKLTLAQNINYEFLSEKRIHGRWECLAIRILVGSDEERSGVERGELIWGRISRIKMGKQL